MASSFSYSSTRYVVMISIFKISFLLHIHVFKHIQYSCIFCIYVNIYIWITIHSNHCLFFGKGVWLEGKKNCVEILPMEFESFYLMVCLWGFYCLFACFCFVFWVFNFFWGGGGRVFGCYFEVDVVLYYMIFFFKFDLSQYF